MVSAGAESDSGAVRSASVVCAGVSAGDRPAAFDLATEVGVSADPELLAGAGGGLGTLTGICLGKIGLTGCATDSDSEKSEMLILFKLRSVSFWPFSGNVQLVVV